MDADQPFGKLKDFDECDDVLWVHKACAMPSFSLGERHTPCEKMGSYGGFYFKAKISPRVAVS